MIASENFVSRAVLEAAGTVFTNKYAEGYPGKRYYGGCDYADIVENIARDRAKRLFGADHVNVQPHSGSQANAAAMMTLLTPGDTILGLDLAHGGHLTHGHKLNFSGKLYRVAGYQVRQDTEVVDYDELEATAEREKPKVIIVEAAPTRASSTSPACAPSPTRSARISCGHGPLRRPRCRWCTSIARAARACGHHDHAQDPPWPTQRHDPCPAGVRSRHRPQRLPRPAGRPPHAHHRGQGRGLPRGAGARLRRLRETDRRQRAGPRGGSRRRGYRVVSGGTDTHLLLMDVFAKGMYGSEAEVALGAAGITVNKNAIPYDTNPPMKPSGIRIGTPALTTRGMKEPEMRIIAGWIAEALEHRNDPARLKAIHGKVTELAESFPSTAISAARLKGSRAVYLWGRENTAFRTAKEFSAWRST